MSENWHELDQLTVKYAKAKSDRVYLEEFRKSKKCILMKEAHRSDPKLSGAAQEREAYAHKDYLEIIEGLRDAVEIEELCRWKLKMFEMRMDVWRTKESTKRAEMNLK